MMSTLRESPNTEFKQLYTSSGYRSLPPELLNTLFHQCNSDDLKQCALACRSWNAAARPIFFSSVVLSSTAKIDGLISLVIKDNAIGEFVKEVDVLDMELNLHSLYLFSKIFKNIESITFDNKYYSMYRGLYDLLSAGEFSSLKNIPGPMNVDQSEIYLKCVDIIKCRMTDLDIIGVKAYESLQQSFHTFIKLKTINIEFYSSLPISVINLFEDITQKSNLPSLKEIEVIMLNDSRFASNELIPRMDDIQPMFNVSDLKISGYTPHTIIDDTFMCYIIKKFPNMQRLKLLSYEDDDYGFYLHLPKEKNQIVLSVDVTVKFLEYISRLSTFNVQHIVTEEKTAAIIESFCSSIRERSLDIPSLYIGYNHDIDEDDASTSCNPVVSIDNFQNSQKHVPSISVGLNPFYDPIFNFGEEERKLIKHNGQYLTKITLDGVPTFSFRVLLTNIVRYCVNLKELVISSTSELLDEAVKYDDPVANHSLTHLTVDPNVICPNLVSLLSYLFAGLKMLSLSSTRTYIKPPGEFVVIMPRLSVKHFQVELSFYYGDYHSKTCSNFRVFVQLDVGEKSRYLLFPMLHTESKSYHDRCPLKFDKEITASEFEERKKNNQNYYIYHMQCKSTEKVSIKYPSERIRSDMKDFVYKIHEMHF